MSGFLDFLTPGVGSAIGAGASLLGGVLGFTGQQSTNAANAAQTMNQINFQSQQAEQDRQFNAQQAGYAMDYGLKTQELQYGYNSALQQQAMGYDAQQAALARQFNADQAQKQMDFQWGSQQEAERYNQAMSSTAYQRGVADMKAAGINPILAAGQGGASSPTVGALAGAAGNSPSPSAPGASVGGVSPPQASFSTVPSGAAARFENPYTSLQNGITSAIGNATQLAKLGTDLKQMQANIDNTTADTLRIGAAANQSNTAAALNQANTAVAHQELINKGKQAGNIDADTAARYSSVTYNNAAAGAQSAQAAYTASQKAYQDYVNKMAAAGVYLTGNPVAGAAASAVTTGDGIAAAAKDAWNALKGLGGPGVPKAPNLSGFAAPRATPPNPGGIPPLY